jgi:TetR/AcrR family transcriptional regulator, cholesterol catabolism regulator
MPTKSDRGKTERYHRMREQVIDVAVQLFSKNGYTGTGVADIGEAAGLARGALYYYIGSKEAVLAEIHDRVLDPLLAEGEAIVALGMPFDVRLRLLSESLLWQIINRQAHVWVFLHEYQQLQGELRTKFRAKRQRFEGFIRDALADGRASDELRIQDVDLATLAFLNLHNYTYQWVRGRQGLGAEALSAFYCEIFLNGAREKAVPLDEAELTRGRDAVRLARGVA